MSIASLRSNDKQLINKYWNIASVWNSIPACLVDKINFLGYDMARWAKVCVHKTIVLFNVALQKIAYMGAKGD